MNEMAVYEGMGRTTYHQLAGAPTSRAPNVVNQPRRLRAIGTVILTTPRQFPANRARRPVKKHPDRLLAAAPVMFGEYHATFLAAEVLASSVHRNILCPKGRRCCTCNLSLRSLRAAFAEILAVEADDGLVFDAANLTAVPIREDQVYGGMRLRTTAHLGSTRITVTIDLGFGDVLGDPQYQVAYQSLLDFPPTMIRAYSPATVIAEKFQAVVVLGLANSRMKDFYDLFTMPKAINIDDTELAITIRRTFLRRETAVPIGRPDGLSLDYANDPIRQTQWRTYTNGTELEGTDLDVIVDQIWAWLGPICAASAEDTVEDA